MRQPSDREIEVAAQAIRQVVADRAGKGHPWPALPLRLRDDYRAEARAALIAVAQERG